MKGNTAINIDNLPAIEPYGQAEPMSEELARMIENENKLWYKEAEPMTPELWRLIEKGLCPDRRRVTTTTPHQCHETHENGDFDFAWLEGMTKSARLFDPGCTADAFRKILREAGFAADPPLIVSVEQPGTGEDIQFIEFEGGGKRHDPAESGR